MAQAPTFSFDTRGAKEKVRKKKTPKVLFRDLRVATGAMRPLTCTACGGATLACAVLISVHLSHDSETSHRETFKRLRCSPRVLESASGAACGEKSCVTLKGPKNIESFCGAFSQKATRRRHGTCGAAKLAWRTTLIDHTSPDGVFHLFPGRVSLLK